MIPEIEREALHCFDRTSLERLQIHSRYLRILVNSNAHRLALRRIQRVYASSGQDCSIVLTKRGVILTLKPTEHNLEELLRRVNNAFIVRLAFDFQPANRPFLFYMRTNAARLQCHALALEAHQTSASIDFDTWEFLGRHMRPRICRVQMNHVNNENTGDYALLFTHDAMRESVSHLDYEFCTLPLQGCLPGVVLLNVSAVETCTISTYADPRPWIAEFVEAFGALTRCTRAVRWVELLHFRFRVKSCWENPVYHPYGQTSSGSEVPTPRRDFIRKRGRRRVDSTTTTESPTAMRFVYVNRVAEKKLEVFVWTIEHIESMHYAFLLEVSDV